MGRNVYKIRKEGDPSVTASNAVNLKRKIKSTKYKDHTEGTYEYVDYKGEVAFKVKYIIVPVNKSSRVVGNQITVRRKKEKEKNGA